MTTNKARTIPSGTPQARSTIAQFDAVFLEHWLPIYRVLVRLVGDHAEAEDLALETFWRLHQRALRHESKRLAVSRRDELGIERVTRAQAPTAIRT